MGSLLSLLPCSYPFLPAGMTRHGKNCTAGAVYTYHEKKKDTGTGLARGADGPQNAQGTRFASLVELAVCDFPLTALTQPT